MGDKQKSSSKKEKKAKRESTGGAGQGSDDVAPVRTEYLAPIAKPLADDKLQKKVLKLVKKAAKRKQVKRGVKEVIKAIRKKTKGVCILAGDISPIDVVTPIPVLCEDNDIPYIFVPSKEVLGQAGLTKRPTSCMLILPKPVKASSSDDDSEAKEFAEGYKEVFNKVQSVQVVY